MIRRPIVRLAGGLALVAALACGDSTGPRQEMVVSGIIENNTANPIPGGTRLLVAWVVSATSQDYSYVHGEGTYDAGAGTFRLELTAPPDTALNGGRVGVGIIFLTTDDTIGEGDDVNDMDPADFVGAAGRYGVIYVAGTPADAAQLFEWAADFDAGFGVGVGQPVPGDFDRFVPVDPSEVVLTVDALDNIDFVEWT